MNAIYLGIDADNNEDAFILDYRLPYIICEFMFCAYFTSEITIRFMAFKQKTNAFKDNWFRFDFFLVMLMVTETWLLPMMVIITGADVSGLPTGPLRLLRLLRLSRLVRLMRAIPELVTMVKGMYIASRAVATSLLMVVMLVYVFAILLHMTVSEEPSVSHYFGSLPLTMWTLMMDGTLMDSTGTVLGKLRSIGSFESICSIVIFVGFIGLSAMTVMNMLIGVLCEVVSAVSAGEKEDLAIRCLKESILVELQKFDDDDNGMISQAELSTVLEDPHSQHFLKHLSIDVSHLQATAAMIYAEVEEIPVQTIMELFLNCRSDIPIKLQSLLDVVRVMLWHYKRDLEVSMTHIVRHALKHDQQQLQLQLQLQLQQHHQQQQQQEQRQEYHGHQECWQLRPQDYEAMALMRQLRAMLPFSSGGHWVPGDLSL
eukprot:NODE_2157_length_2280_cov_5.378077.p1 GENE.NODE_2157_length_2280_cov_5.378077~~NODE_2157_length_2280_cov_5.378077.p1  ORF type:complete len:428 (-),score=148.44 NODE_2157_length_2280_cov_5.378077:231-1514(-)